jgi:hypothetical protein
VFRRREMLENGTHATIAEIAATEKSMSFTSGASCAVLQEGRKNANIHASLELIWGIPA